MKTTKTNNEKYSINMMAYGIKTIVQASKKKIDWYMNEFATQPDKKFGGGIGKVALLNYLGQCISLEDDFFNQSHLSQIEEPKRWQEYLDDCVAFACLHSFMNGAEVPQVTSESALEQIDMVRKILGEPHAVNHIRTFGSDTRH